jgi:molybdopterin synthase sulfur carrier subunit
MTVDVRIPPILRRHTDGQPVVKTSGQDIAHLIDALEAGYQGVKPAILDHFGGLHRFVNIYRNGEDIRFLGDLGTPLSDGDVVAIVPAVAGGSRPPAGDWRAASRSGPPIARPNPTAEPAVRARAVAAAERAVAEVAVRGLLRSLSTPRASPLARALEIASGDQTPVAMGERTPGGVLRIPQ